MSATPRSSREQGGISHRHVLLLRSLGLVALLLAAKLLVHQRGWELLSLNPLFSGIVAANVFLMGFLLNGVLSDYKESERLPGELAASLENLWEEVRGIGLSKPEAPVAPCLKLLSTIARDFVQWFHKRHRTADLTHSLNELTAHFSALEPFTQATLVARLKQEQASLRRILIRIHTIRETSFVSSAYLLADVVTVLVCVGLVLVRIEPFREALFFAGVISCLMIFLLMLIRDLDNPFGYYQSGSGEDVSLKPVHDAAERLARALPQ